MDAVEAAILLPLEHHAIFSLRYFRPYKCKGMDDGKEQDL